VYLARDLLKDERLVAVKVLRPELAESLGADRFLREVRTTRRLDHPYIVPVLDEGADGDRLYFITPYMDGGTLRERLTKERQLSIGTAVAIAQSVAAALEHAHAQGIIHRDVKPENILFAGDEARLADFGIARVLDDAVGWTTTTGLVRGTPAYMSPEQAAGQRDLDGRSDVYSLGIVLYEMLAGLAPFAAATPQGSIAQRLTHPPEALTRYRPMVPAELEETVRIALATTPADRFASAREFAEALRGTELVHSTGGATTGLTGGGWPVQTRKRRRRWALIGASLAAAAAAAWSGQRRYAARLQAPIPVDTTMLLVFPPELAPGVHATINPRTKERLNDAFRQWRGLTLVDRFRADSVVSHIVGPRQSAHLARSLGAGRFVRTQLTPIGDSIDVYAAIFDTDQSEPLTQATARIAANDDPKRVGAGSLDTLAADLLIRGRGLSNDIRGTRTLPALQAMARGRTALDDWALPTADSALSSALQFDPASTRIAYWLAQLRAWRGEPAARWKELAARGASDTTALAPAERRPAIALAALGADHFDAACREYDEVRTRHPDDFVGWYGAAQCRDLDRTVIRDTRSPSGWRFRSSLGKATYFYSRALILLPRASRVLRGSAFEPLRRKLFTSSNDIALGVAVVSEGGHRTTIRFSARPSLLGDSIAFVPYPMRESALDRDGVTATGLRNAILRSRRYFHEITAAWAAATPQSAVVKEAEAVSLDLLGDASGADTLRAARALTSDPELRMRLAVSEALMRLRYGLPGGIATLREVGRTVDSLLSVGGRTRQMDAALSPLAAAAGRCKDIARLIAAGAEGVREPIVVPEAIVALSTTVTVRAVMGCSDDGDSASIDRLVRSTESLGGSAQSSGGDLANYFFLNRAVTRSWPLDRELVRRLGHASDDYLLRAQYAWLNGDTSVARQTLTRVEAGRARRGTVATFDATLAEARLWLALGDTTSATKVLDDALTRTHEAAPDALLDPVQAAGLQRSLSLRATVARARGDVSGYQLWLAAQQAIADSIP
jgi:serine/threonine-protein kinase